MTQNEDVYAISCQVEIDGKVISCGSAKTIKSYIVENFEVASSRMSEIFFFKNLFMTALLRA